MIDSCWNEKLKGLTEDMRTNMLRGGMGREEVGTGGTKLDAA